MPRYRIDVILEKGNIKTVAAKLKDVLPPNTNVNIVKDEPPTSRADRLSQAMSLVDDARSEVEELRDEMQNWLDTLPENLQNGSKADEINDAISELDQLVSDLENVNGDNVSFPGMMG